MGVHVPVGLDLGVSDRVDRLKNLGQILFRLVTHRIELHPELAGFRSANPFTATHPRTAQNQPETLFDSP